MATVAARPPRCSEISAAGGESLGGTAPQAAAWLLVEQAPPWGRDAVRESGLDARVGGELVRTAKELGLKVVLIRPAAPARRSPARRRVFAAWLGSLPFVQALSFGSDGELLELGLPALARGERLAGGDDHYEPLQLVCTNGRRDACCARYGPEAAKALAAAAPATAWECTHLGGHRFAATMLCLPSGACYGRLDPAATVRAARLTADGLLDLEHLRGLVGRSAAVQAAEIRLRRRLGLERIEDLAPVSERVDGDGELEVGFATAAGETVLVRMRRVVEERATSCDDDEVETIASWFPVAGED